MAREEKEKKNNIPLDRFVWNSPANYKVHYSLFEAREILWLLFFFGCLCKANLSEAAAEERANLQGRKESSRKPRSTLSGQKLSGLFYVRRLYDIIVTSSIDVFVGGRVRGVIRVPWGRTLKNGSFFSLLLLTNVKCTTYVRIEIAA